MSRFLPSLLRLLAVVGLALPSLGAEPFLRPHDVIAFVGGEDMVALSEYGYLELLLVRALPDYQLRFRNLAWEGDTVFEQRRDLNFPPLEAQLDKIGATVVIAQFGQMESLAARDRFSGGKDRVAEFSTAYGQLLKRLSGSKERRVIAVLIPPFEQGFPGMDDRAQHNFLDFYSGSWDVLSCLSTGPNFAVIDPRRIPSQARAGIETTGGLENKVGVGFTRDGIHRSRIGHLYLSGIFRSLTTPTTPSAGSSNASDVDHEVGLARDLAHFEETVKDLESERLKPLLALIRAKNRLWFNYWRPQNWAFLNGDRTSQPSSRDYLDPSKRWFPDEIEQFVPLIEAKEREIDALAAQLKGK